MASSSIEGIKKMIAPLIIPTNISSSVYYNSHSSNNTLTPPLTPLESSSALHPANADPPSPTPALLQLPRTSLLGTGAWSCVYGIQGAPLAVKAPVNASAHAILESEAKILNYLSSTLPPSSGVAGFHGYDRNTASIYMDLIPDGTLEEHVLTRTAEGRTNMRAPIVGMPQWLFLAERLVRTFTELKRAGVVHGDVKWSNILLREWTPVPGEDAIWAEYILSGEGKLFEPILVDFSSSHVVDPSGDLPDAISAVTTSFAAPELLQSFLSRPPTPTPMTMTMTTPPVTPTKTKAHPVPTYASDLYSLSLSLLAATVGSEVYYNAGRHVGIYVRQGNPMGWVKADERRMRVGRNGVVSEVLEGCFGKTAEGRTGVEEVGVRVEGWKRRWWKEGRASGNARWGC